MPGLTGLVLLSLCLNLHTCRGFPSLLPNLGTEAPLQDDGCGTCEPDLCPETRGCRAGLVPDPCGCCMECGNLEGQACDPGNRSVYYGLCGTGLRCQADRTAGGEDEEEEEEVCVCEEPEAVCGSDGTTYMNMCQFREAAFSKAQLRTRGRGPCKAGRPNPNPVEPQLVLELWCRLWYRMVLLAANLWFCFSRDTK